MHQNKFWLFRVFCEKVFTAEAQSSQRSENFLTKNSFLRVLRASAVQSPSPASQKGLKTIFSLWCKMIHRKSLSSCKLSRKILILLLVKILFSAGCAPQVFYRGTTLDNAAVANNEVLVLTGNDRLEINRSHYTQKNNIILKDNAQLIIRDSLFEHRHDHSFQFQLRAYDNGSVVVDNSEIRSSEWLNWYFYDNSSLVLQNANNNQSSIWHIFRASARARADRVDRFWGTMNENVVVEVADTPETFIEFVYPAGARVDEAFPRTMTDYSFPNQGETGITTKLTIKNSRASSWGITVNPGDDITIRDTHSLVVTFHISKPYNNVTADFSGLRVEHHEDQTWQVADGDTRLRLINTKTEKWSPIVSNNNTLIVKDSDISDNAFSSDNAKVIYERSVIGFLHANAHVHMMIKDSVVQGDVVATENSVIELIRTQVQGKLVEKDNGRIVVN